LLLTGVNLRAFESPLVVVERDVVVRLRSFKDAPDLRFRHLEERGGSLLLAALADLADKVLDADVLGGHLLEEAILDGVAERWATDAFAIGDFAFC